MKIKQLHNLSCIDCGSKIFLKHTHANYRIYACECYEYPEIYNIIYLHKDRFAPLAVKDLKNNNLFSALKKLLNIRLKIFLPLYFLYKTHFLTVIGYYNFLRLLLIFSVDKSWIAYLLRRKDSEYYEISRFFFQKIAFHKDTVLDIGCGDGQIFSEIYACNPKRLVGIDKSFYNLFLARNFFAKKDTELICCDIEKGIPMKNTKFDAIHMNDTFQYIVDKKEVLSGLSKLIASEGTMAIIHNHKIKMKGQIVGISENKLLGIAKSIGFNSFVSLDDNLFEPIIKLNLNTIWENVGSSSKLNTAYSMFATKSKRFINDKKNNQIVFISPHLDDAVLSCCGLLIKLAEADYEIKIITVFTKASGRPYSPQANEHLGLAGYTNADLLFNARKKEDIKAAKYLGATCVHLDYVDAAWRKNTNGDFVYKNSKHQYSGKISKYDNTLFKKILASIEKHIKNDNSIVFSPLGIGSHVDHLIIRNITEKLRTQKVYWEDYPYNLKAPSGFVPPKNSYVLKIINKELIDKKKVVRFYKSQLPVLFKGNEMKFAEEKYYVE